MKSRPRPTPKGRKVAKGDGSVESFIASLTDAQTAKDSLALIDTMRRISGHQPKLWNLGTIGFDAYHYKYDSGREGDCQALGFYPREGKLTVYLMDGTARHAAQLARLGKHTTSRVCLYIRRLSDLQLPVLEQILQSSYAYLKSKDGQMHRVE
ncbi:MAG: DUF1801 domain-containing protein [Myxococcales bacterium]